MKRILFIVVLALALLAASSTGGGFFDNWAVEPAAAVVLESQPEMTFDGGNGTPGLPACGWAYHTAYVIAYGTKDGRTGYWRCIPTGNFSGYWAPV